MSAIPGEHQDFVLAVCAACQDATAHRALRDAMRDDQRYRHVPETLLPLLPAGVGGDAAQPYRLVAASLAEIPRPELLALARSLEPRRTDRFDRSIGICLAQAFAAGVFGSEDGAAQSLEAITYVSADTLYRRLPRLLRRMSVQPDLVDHARLLYDLERWPKAHREISRRWIDDFHEERFRARIRDAAANDIGGSATD